MNTSERNWLIRTSQNQILGPIAKAKVVEFIQKGALGLTDEVSSGNGYWFHLREKDLVEKYLYGDLPQSYNPISEAKSVLSKKENPEKTTSINASPANSSQDNNTQVINIKDLNLQVLPKNDDLEFPDVTKITNMDFDLAPSASKGESLAKSNPVLVAAPVQIAPEDLKMPSNDDLEFPDLDFISNIQSKIKEEVEEVKFVLSQAEVSNVLADKVTKEATSPEIKLEIIEKEAVPVEVKPVREIPKMLHERKVKSVKKDSEPKEVERKVPTPPREIAPELKNRNDSYLFIVLIVLVLLILASVFYYYRFILNKPLPV